MEFIPRKYRISAYAESFKIVATRCAPHFLESKLERMLILSSSVAEITTSAERIPAVSKTSALKGSP